MLTCPATVFSPAVQSNAELFRLDGQLRPGLARVDGTTGALDAAFDLHLVTPDFPTPKIEALAVNPTGTRLVAIGVI